MPLFVHRIPLYHGGIFFVARYKVKSVNWEMKDAKISIGVFPFLLPAW